jgi:hypothetical protein
MRHELYGSLNAIAIIAGLLEERGRKGPIDGDEVAKLAGRLIKQVRRSTSIVDHYIEFLGGASAPDPGERRSEPFDVEQAARVFAGRTGHPVAVAHPANAVPHPALGIAPAEWEFVVNAVWSFSRSASPSGRLPVVRASVDDSCFSVEVYHEGGEVSVDDLHVFERGLVGVSPPLLDMAAARRIVTDAGGELVPAAGVTRIRVPLELE